MTLIEQIIYLERVKSALADMRELAEHPQFNVRARQAMTGLVVMAETLEASIKSHPDVQPFVTFMEGNNEN